MPLPDPTGWAPDFLQAGAFPGYAGGLSEADIMALMGESVMGPNVDEAASRNSAHVAEYMRQRREEMSRRGGLDLSLGSPASVAALVMGGAAAGGAFGGTAPAGATTYPYAAGGTVTATPLGAGTASGAAGGAAGAAGGILDSSGAVIPGTAGGAAAAGGGFLQNWLPTIAGGVNSLLGARAYDRAADAESAGLQAGIDEQRRQFDLTRQDMMPWLTAGQGALNRLQDPNAHTASPGYQWLRNEGQRDIGNSFAARGGAASGNALRALSEFQTGLAQQDYNNWWNREAGIAGVGQNTAVNLGNLGQNTAGNVSNYLSGQGASRASGVMGRYGSLAQGVNEGVSNWLYRRRRAA